MTTEAHNDTLETTTFEEVTTFVNQTANSVYTRVTTTFTTSLNVTTSVPEDNSNLGLIVGLSVGIPCGVAVIIAVIVTILCLRKKKDARKQDLSNKNNQMDSFYANRIPSVPHTHREPDYENLPFSKRSDPIYVNSENVYETRLASS